MWCGLITWHKGSIGFRNTTLLTNISCVKWFNERSGLFRINFGVRQRSVLAPFLFAVCIDDLAESCSKPVPLLSYFMLMTYC